LANARDYSYSICLSKQCAHSHYNQHNDVYYGYIFGAIRKNWIHPHRMVSSATLSRLPPSLRRAYVHGIFIHPGYTPTKKQAVTPPATPRFYPGPLTPTGNLGLLIPCPNISPHMIFPHTCPLCICMKPPRHLQAQKMISTALKNALYISTTLLSPSALFTAAWLNGTVCAK
jgi:hypothetical protein